MTAPSGPAFDEAEVVRLLARLAEVERDEGLFTPLMLGPFTAFSLIGILQLAWRHPVLSQAQRDLIEGVARPMQAWFDQSGPLAQALEMGWDVVQDREPGESL